LARNVFQRCGPFVFALVAEYGPPPRCFSCNSHPHIRACMSRFLAFWRMCAGHAVVGNSAFDKDWQWAFGNPMSAMLGPAVLAFLSGTADIITGSTIANAFLAAFFAFVVTWLVAFLVRLFSLPAEYYYTEKERADPTREYRRPSTGPNTPLGVTRGGFFTTYQR